MRSKSVALGRQSGVQKMGKPLQTQIVILEGAQVLIWGAYKLLRSEVLECMREPLGFQGSFQINPPKKTAQHFQTKLKWCIQYLMFYQFYVD